MFEDKKIEKLQKKISELKQENELQKKEIEKLQKEITEKAALVKAAHAYKDEHEKAIAMLSEAKEQYKQALLTVVEEKKRYANEFNELIKNIQ